MADFPTPVVALARLKVPRNFSSRNPQMRRDLASALRTRTHDLAPPPSRRAGQPRASPRVASGTATRSTGCGPQLRAHPCHGCPDREDHARWAERWFKLDKDVRDLRRRVEERTNTVARAVRPGVRGADGTRLPRRRSR